MSKQINPVPGRHYWGLMGGKLIVVLCTSDQAGRKYYEVCGPWECGVSLAEVKIVAGINRPRGHSGTELYYEVGK